MIYIVMHHDTADYYVHQMEVKFATRSKARAEEHMKDKPSDDEDVYYYAIHEFDENKELEVYLP